MDYNAIDYVRTRIAPTPSGFLHVGNILSFSLTAGLARQAGASVLLRIDDLDRERVSVDYLEDIFETLRFLGISWGEGPVGVEDFERNWTQVRRMGLYEEALGLLRESGAVFACTCSRSQLAGLQGGYPGTCEERGISLDADGVSWRLRTDGLAGEMRDFVVRKKDGFPAYQLTSLVDDLYFGVDLIVRGEDLRPSTLAQQYLSNFLTGGEAFRAATVIHHPLLLSADGEKLSKSAGATSIHYLRQQGFAPADVYQLIARLLGFGDPVRDWEQLAGLFFGRGYGFGG